MDTATIVGAYALRTQEPRTRDEVDRGLLERPVDGLEICDQELFGDRKALANRLGAWTESVVTLIPGTMQRLSADASFGLASVDETGRRAAVQWCIEARRAVDALDQQRGQGSVRAVQVHSAPGRGRASVDALARSLDELQLARWGDVRLAVEHCDACQPDRSAQKGFLSLADEIAAAQTSGCLVSVNWGRSAIEGADPQLPLAHVQQATAAGVLGGLVLSGAGHATSRSQAWEDAHLGHHDDEPSSLMTHDRVACCIDAARQGPALLYLGVKITAPPEASAGQRLAMVDTILAQTTTVPAAPAA